MKIMILTSNAMAVITMITNGRTVDIATKIVTIIMNKSKDHGKRDHYEKEYHHRDRKGRGDDEDHEDYYYKDYRHGEKDFRDYENKWEYNGTLDFFLSLLLFLIKINVSFVYYKSYCKLKLFINKYFLYLFL